MDQSDIQYDLPKDTPKTPLEGTRARPSLTARVVSYGLAQSEEEAGRLLLGCVIFFILIAIFIIWFGIPRPLPPPYEPLM